MLGLLTSFSLVQNEVCQTGYIDGVLQYRPDSRLATYKRTPYLIAAVAVSGVHKIFDSNTEHLCGDVTPDLSISNHSAFIFAFSCNFFYLLQNYSTVFILTFLT